MIGMSVENQHLILNNCSALFVHFVDNQYAVYSGSAGSKGMYKIYPAVIIPEGAGINKPFPGFDQNRLVPFACRILCLNHVNSKVRITIINIEFSLMVSKTGSPNPVSMLGYAEMILRCQFSKSMSYDLPVNKII